jgi:hypothetical protein
MSAGTLINICLFAFSFKYFSESGKILHRGGDFMRYKLICCEVFLREACIVLADSPNTIDPEFTPKGAHDTPDYLRELIQRKIDEAEAHGGYDAILLGFGLCGNSTAGLTARSVPLIIPRAHDCCTIFLGSKERFTEHFMNNLSKEWSSTGYMERGESIRRESDISKMLGRDKSFQDLVESYGEENAEYIWETLHPDLHDNELVFIEIPETSHLGYCEKLKSIAQSEGRTVCVINGDMRLIRDLVSGNWRENEFLIVSPGKVIKAEYDYDNIVTAI